MRIPLRRLHKLTLMGIASVEQFFPAINASLMASMPSYEKHDTSTSARIWNNRLGMIFHIRIVAVDLKFLGTRTALRALFVWLSGVLTLFFFHKTQRQIEKKLVEGLAAAKNNN